MGVGGMSAFADDLNLKVICGGASLAKINPDRADGEERRNVGGNDQIHLRVFQDPGGDHLPGSVAALLAGLEDELHLAVDPAPQVG
jgi:hypothetical protein